MDQNIKNGLVYRITNTKNGKVYIGQTIGTIKKRFERHKRPSYRKDRPLYRAFNKYGVECFKIEPLHENVPIDLLDTIEEWEIFNHQSLAPNGYNLKYGGTQGRPHEETKEKMRIAAREKEKHRTEEQKKQKSERCKEAALMQWASGKQKEIMKKRKQQKEHEKEIQYKNRQINKKQEHINKIQNQIKKIQDRHDRHKLNKTNRITLTRALYPKGRAVYCKEIDKIFNSMPEAAKETGDRREYILRNCEGKRIVKTKYTWSYYNT